MGFLPVDQLADDLEKVDDISRDQTAILSNRMVELLEVAPAGMAHLMGPGGVEATLTKQRGDPRREILVQVELQSARRTRPGYRATTSSGVSPAFSSIRRWISSRYRRK